MDQSSLPSSSSNHQYGHQHTIRVIKPNRHNHNSNESNKRQQQPSNSHRTKSNLQHSSSNSNSNSEQSSIPSVKILAKSNNYKSQVTNRPSINNARENDNNNRNSGTFNNQNRTSITNSVLEKQLTRLQIVPSNEDREKDLLFNCTKLLDGDFSLLDPTILERLLLSDSQISSASANSSNATNVMAPSGNQSTNVVNQSFSIVGAVGLDGVGKSSLLNMLANRKVFKTHSNMGTSSGSIQGRKNCLTTPLTHVTNGVDLHITSERLFLLDTQPLLSPSILDEFLRNNATVQMPFGAPPHHHHHHHNHHNASGNGTGSLSNVVGFDITEPENFAFIYSMQLLTFMFVICDHLILVLDSFSLDAYLLKLIATSLMMVGDSVQKANLIIYLKPQIENQSNDEKNFSKLDLVKPSRVVKEKRTKLAFLSLSRSLTSHNKMIDLLKQTIVSILGPNVNVEFVTDEQRLLTAVLKPPSRNLLVTDQQSRPIQYNTERAWYQSMQRFWENSIRKSTLFADYARYLP
ncbi:smg-9, nonsense mediated mRNA decay factor [Blomia tropicalis]|nr:smg-9, nonsense mediated mRNA decay factor [Blomia tropicalis]